MNHQQHHCWKRFVEEGNELFDYLIHNYDHMIDDTTIKHFNIREGMCWLNEYINTIKSTYNNDIQQKLISWIKKEFESGNLFKNEKWKPFPDDYAGTDMFFGYRKMFQYKHYLFQLAIEWGCRIDDCIYCKKNDNMPNFCLAFYGWKDTAYKNLQPSNLFSLLDDDTMPESYWKIDT